MARRIITYLLFFYTIYFLGHFLMSMAYRFGPTATGPLWIVLPVAVVFTLWKAARASKERAQILYGILAGFFMWCFFGEFLEYKGVIGIADVESLPLLVPYVVLVSFMVFLKYLPVGARFALGHFGCIWFLHFILVNQAEILQFKNQELFQILIVVSGVAFFLIALFLFFKMLGARREKAFVAYLLVSFTCFWATVETLQVVHILPDYTYFSYWARKISPESSKNYGGSFRINSEKKIESIKKNYTWESAETRGLAVYLLKKIQFSLVLDDLSERLGERMREGNREKVDEAFFCQVVEESISERSRANFKSIVARYDQAFKGGKPVFRINHASEREKLNTLLSDKYEERIAAIKKKYAWEREEAGKFAVYLLKELPFTLVTDDFSKRLDEKIKEENREEVDETLFCHVMEESFLATTLPAYNNMIKKYVQEYKKENSINNKGGKA